MLSSFRAVLLDIVIAGLLTCTSAFYSAFYGVILEMLDWTLLLDFDIVVCFVPGIFISLTLGYASGCCVMQFSHCYLL